MLLRDDTLPGAVSAFAELPLVMQGMMITEMWIDRIARTVGKSPEDVRELNMYKENDTTFYGQRLDGCQLRPCWNNVWPRPVLPTRAVPTSSVLW